MRPRVWTTICYCCGRVTAAAYVPAGTSALVSPAGGARAWGSLLRKQSGDPGWLGQRRDQWRESGQPWDAYWRSWALREGLHSGEDIVGELDARFDRRLLAYGPYFFADLAGTSENDERTAIAAGDIQANRIEYVGRRQ